MVQNNDSFIDSIREALGLSPDTSKPEDDMRIDPLSLPVGANPSKDRRVGTTEFGEPLYETQRGTQYSIRKEMPQSKYTTEPGTMERVEEVGLGAYETAKTAIENPLETLGAVAEGAINVGKGIARLLQGTGTYGDLLGITGFVPSSNIARVGGLGSPDATTLGSNFGNTRKARPDLPIVEKFPEAEKVELPDFQDVMSSLKDRYKDSLMDAQERGAGASERSYARRLSVLENADEQLVNDIIDIGNNEDPREAARALFRKYDEFTIPSDVRVGDLEYLSQILNFEFSTEVPPGSQGTRFRSATEEVVQNLEVGKKGLLGARFLKQLLKNPDVRDTEWMSLDLQINPKKLYTQNELIDIVGSNAFDVTVDKINKYESFQRQRKVGLPDTEKEYFELVVNANARQGARPFKANEQHYSNDTLAHTRASIRGPLEGMDFDFILVEELQSDLLQKGFEPARKGKEADIEANFKNVDEKFANELERTRSERYQDFVWNDETDELDVVDLSPDENPQVKLLDHWNTLTDGEKKDLVYAASYADEDVRRRETRYAVKLYFNPVIMYSDDVSNITDSILRSVEPSITALRKPPIAKTSESVSLAIDALMAEGQKKGVTNIVIPPLEKIIEARYTKGSKEYQDAMSKKSGFYQTYVDGVNKKIKELQQLGGVKVEKIDMPYGERIYTSYGERISRGPVVETLTALGDEDLDRVFTRIYGEAYTSGELGTRNQLIRNEPYEIRLNSDLEEAYKDALTGLGLIKTSVAKTLQGTKIDFTELAKERNLARPKFAEGGMIMDNSDAEMQDLLSEGTDPVSGNDVPLGATPEEVRDDIDASVSVNEYVIPAYAVRYFGPNFFDELLGAAQQGWDRIKSGEEPMPAKMDTSEAPMKEGFAEGGVVPAPVGGGYGGYGGTGAGFGGFESKTFVNPDTGQEIIIYYFGGKPMSRIPEGFREKGATAVEEQQMQQSTDDGEDAGVFGGGPLDKPVSEWTNEDITKYTANLKNRKDPLKLNMLERGIAGLLGSIIGGPLGGFAATKLLEKANALKAKEVYEKAMSIYTDDTVPQDVRKSVYEDVYYLGSATNEAGYYASIARPYTEKELDPFGMPTEAAEKKRREDQTISETTQKYDPSTGTYVKATEEDISLGGLRAPPRPGSLTTPSAPTSTPAPKKENDDDYSPEEKARARSSYESWADFDN